MERTSTNLVTPVVKVSERQSIRSRCGTITPNHLRSRVILIDYNRQSIIQLDCRDRETNVIPKLSASAPTQVRPRAGKYFLTGMRSLSYYFSRPRALVG